MFVNKSFNESATRVFKFSAYFFGVKILIKFGIFFNDVIKGIKKDIVFFKNRVRVTDFKEVFIKNSFRDHAFVLPGERYFFG